ncbi:protein kinase [Candidatus Obscuribacterales bacterium]|nr:protein kinase [Candidatus Obscuribacterales bacterium]
MSGGPLIDSYDSGDISKIANDQTLVGRYKVLQRLGSGGTSTVYKASDLVLKRFVAVKLLRAGTRTQEQLVRLQREARAICQLQHPNIIDAFDFIVGDDNIPVLAMEFVDGVSLDEFVKQNGPLELDQAIAVCEQICSALNYAHEHNILHRDLKPANVIVQRTNPVEIKIIDFGIAKLSDEDTSLTSAGVIVGTPSFISPEQANGETVDVRSDIYSLGCLMYKILTGRNPFRGATMMETLQAQIHEEAPTLEEGNGSREYSQDLEDIIAKALKKDPGERFQTMSEFSNALNAIRPANNDSQFETSETETPPSGFTAESKRSKLLFPMILLAVLVAVTITSLQIANIFSNADEPVVDTNSDTFLRIHQIGKRPVGKWIWYFLRTDTVSDDQLKALGKLGVDRLTLAKTNIADSQLPMISKLPLKLLDIRETKITNAGLRTICDTMPKLQSILIEDCPNIDSNGYQELRRLTNLRVLSLRHTTVSDKDLKILCPALQKLNVLYVANSPNITNDAIDEILKLKELYALRIDGTKISPVQIKRLSVLPRLLFLGLAELGITDNNMPDFSRNISMLDLSSNAFSIKSLDSKVLKLPELWYMDLRGCPRINDDSDAKHTLQSTFRHTQGYVVLLDDHEGILSPEGYLNAETYKDSTLKQFTLEDRKAVIREAMHLFPELEKGF